MGWFWGRGVPPYVPPPGLRARFWLTRGTGKRPLGVTLVALLQFCKAGFLIIIAAIGWWRHGALPELPALCFQFIYFASGGKFYERAEVIPCPLFALLLSVFGWGLWRLRLWAPILFLSWYGLLMIYWVRNQIFDTWTGLGRYEWWRWTPFQHRMQFYILSVDGVVALYLLTSTTVGRAFGLAKSHLSELTPPRRKARLRPLDEAYEYALAEYGNKGYEFWKNLIGREPIIFPHPNDARYEVEIIPVWDGVSEQRAGGRIRVLVSVFRATSFGAKLPTRSFLVFPDGTVVPFEANGLEHP
jgi:hypothetical protein